MLNNSANINTDNHCFMCQSAADCQGVITPAVSSRLLNTKTDVLILHFFNFKSSKFSENLFFQLPNIFCNLPTFVLKREKRYSSLNFALIINCQKIN